MARKKGSVPAYRLHKASGRGYVHAEGMQHLFPGPFKSLESLSAYHRFVAQWAAHGGEASVEATNQAYTTADLDRDYRAYLEAKHDGQWIHNNMTPLLKNLGGVSLRQSHATTPLLVVASDRLDVSYGSRALASRTPR
jgi:hypothetical protein